MGTARSLGSAGCLLALLVSFSSAGIFDRNEVTPAIKINQGQLTGLFQTSTGGKKFMAFYGVPYGMPPVGDLRFKAPQPAAAWEGVRAAHSEGDMCPQPTPPAKPQASVTTAADALKVVASLPGAAKAVARHMMHVSEDCLYLNVYTPVDKLPADAALPVLVWFHGGGFLMGSGDYMMYGPETLMDRGVVLVTLNYRVGPFGFLATNSSDAPGNAGLKDQRLALKWVRDNIQHFGGDPAKVTIYGGCAGSVSAHMQVLSPGSKGLFHGAIMSGGTAQSFWAMQSDVDGNARRLAEAMGAGADTVADAVRRTQFLRDAPVKDVLKGVGAMMAEKSDRSLVHINVWAPVVEVPGGEEPFFEQHPVDILKAGEFNTEVPVVLGVNDKEGTWIAGRVHDDDVTRLQANPTLLLTPNLYEKLDANGREELTAKIKDLYFKGKPIGKDTLTLAADVFGDEAIIHGNHMAAHWHMKHAKAPVYQYLFTQDAFGVISFMMGTSKTIKGAGHGDDWGYVFKNHLVSDAGTTEKERYDMTVNRMSTLIANFVSQMNPTPAKTDLLNVEWAPSTLDKPGYLEIGDNLVMKDGNVFPERMQFWDEASGKM
ncbi:juvenile hormone esterase-like [Thrips palmi]|uniref:Juvenile hormone esterase-like n=1 Tax=Thrips palmi TaxID=161013 RepID=A0A6P9AFI0_THRPL|nr:juvenile hormone esterase-like [Thrips palmi]